MGGAAGGPGRPGVETAQLVELEAWFLRRGVPQLVEGYATEHRVDARAAPWLLLWLITGTVLWWGVRPGADTAANLVGVVLTLVSIGAGVAVLRHARGHVMWWVDRRLEAADVLALFPLVAVPSALVEHSWLHGLTDGGRVLLGVTAIYGIVGLGLSAIAWWSVRRLLAELSHITALLAGTLPVLLILVLFLIFAGELWEAAHLLTAGEVTAALALLLVVGVLLVVTAFRTELPSIEAGARRGDASLVAGTPAEPLTDGREPLTAPALGFLQRTNLTLLVLIGQLIQSVSVALVVSGFLLVFGLLVLPAALQERWIGAAVVELAAVGLLGERRVLTAELVTISVLLGSVVGLYFTGLAVTDSSYRSSHFGRILAEVRVLVAAHALYAAARDASSPAADVAVSPDQ